MAGPAPDDAQIGEERRAPRRVRMRRRRRPRDRLRPVGDAGLKVAHQETGPAPGSRPTSGSAPRGSSGSSNTRARVSSAVVGGSENTGMLGTGVTRGAVRLILTGGSDACRCCRTSPDGCQLAHQAGSRHDLSGRQCDWHRPGVHAKRHCLQHVRQCLERTFNFPLHCPTLHLRVPLSLRATEPHWSDTAA